LLKQKQPVCQFSGEKIKTQNYKKIELMLTRCAKAYSSSCSQTVSLLPAI